MITNIYLTIVILVVLMFLDYYLTRKGFELYKKKYYKVIASESYELNPRFKDSISKKKYSFVHLVGVICICLLVYFIHYFSFTGLLGFKQWTFFIVQGMLFSMLILVNSSHIQNILIFGYFNRNHSTITGRIKQKTIFSLEAGIAHKLAEFIVFFSVFLLNPSYFLFGFSLGPLALLLKLRRWKKKLKKLK